MNPTSWEDLVKRWNEAWNAHDLDTLGRMMTPDVLYEDPAILFDGVTRGRQQVVDWLRAMMRAMPDLRFEERNVFVSTDGRRAVWEWRGKGTFLHPIAKEGTFQPPVIEPTTGAFDMPGADILWLEDGLIFVERRPVSRAARDPGRRALRVEATRPSDFRRRTASREPTRSARPKAVCSGASGYRRRRHEEESPWDVSRARSRS